MRERGVSVIELIAGLTVAALGILIAYKTFLFFNTQAVTQKRIAAGQSELLPVQAALEKNLRRAGFGIPRKGPRRNGFGGVDTLASLEFLDNGSQPDGLRVRGNFAGTATNLRADFLRASSGMAVRAGGASAFRAGDLVVMDDREHQEYLVVTGVSSSSSILFTGPRLYDYPTGTPVVKVNTVEFRPAGDSLLIYTDGTRRRLARNLSDFRIYPVLADGSLDSVPPVPLEQVVAVEFRVRLRIAKPGATGWHYRDAVDRVTLRNVR